MYQRTARLDLDNYNNDTEDGLHITSMTGSWLSIVQGFAQMKTAHDQLRFAPFLQKTWKSLLLSISIVADVYCSSQSQMNKLLSSY